MGATIGKAWCVSDVNGWNAYLRCLAVDERQRLAQGLDAIENACCRCSCDAYLLSVSVQLVSLSIGDGLVNGEDDGCTALALADGWANTCGLLDVRSEHIGVTLHVLAVGAKADDGFCAQRERCVIADFHLLRTRNDVEVRSLSRCGRG